MQLLAARKRKLDLGTALVVEIELERHQCHSFAFHRADQLVDLATVKKELAYPLGRMIEAAALEVFRNVGIDEPDLAAARIGVRFRYGRFALAQRFHFRSGERDPSLDRLADFVVESCLAIVGDDASVAVRFCRHGTVNPVEPSIGLGSR